MRSLHTATGEQPQVTQLEKSLCSNEELAQPKIRINKVIKRKKKRATVKEIDAVTLILPCFLFQNFFKKRGQCVFRNQRFKSQLPKSTPPPPTVWFGARHIIFLSFSSVTWREQYLYCAVAERSVIIQQVFIECQALFQSLARTDKVPVFTEFIF